MNLCANLWHEATNERHSLSHALSGVTAPSKREPGWLSPFTRLLAEIRGFGRFSSPLRNSVIFYRLRSSGDTPSVTPVGRDSSLRKGAGKRSHSSGYSLKSGVAGDFHRPYERAAPFIGDFHCPYGGSEIFISISVSHRGKGVKWQKGAAGRLLGGGYSSMRLMSAPRAVSFPIKFS